MKSLLAWWMGSDNIQIKRIQNISFSDPLLSIHMPINSVAVTQSQHNSSPICLLQTRRPNKVQNPTLDYNTMDTLFELVHFQIFLMTICIGSSQAAFFTLLFWEEALRLYCKTVYVYKIKWDHLSDRWQILILLFLEQNRV